MSIIWTGTSFLLILRKNYETLSQCDQIYAKIRHFGNIFKPLAHLQRVYLVFDKFRTQFGNFSNTIGQIFVVLNGQWWTNNLAIWSHYSLLPSFVFSSIPRWCVSLSFEPGKRCYETFLPLVTRGQPYKHTVIVIYNSTVVLIRYFQ